MKFLYFGDRHNSEKVPKSRTDDYLATCDAKDNEIVELGKKHKVSAFLQPGDFWTDDDSKPSNSFIQRTMAKWSSPEIVPSNMTDIIKNGDIDEILKLKEALKNHIPLVGAVGNHDLFGNNIKSLPDTTTGLLLSMGLMHNPTKDKPMIFTTEDGTTVAITTTNYHSGTDLEKNIDDYIIDEKLGDIHIHIVHGMLLEKSAGDMFRHTTLDKIQHTKADLTLCGHHHIGFGIIEHNGKYFANIGAVVRMTNDKSELSRKPSVLLISVENKKLELERIYLESAKDGSEVLDREVIEEKKVKENALAKYKQETKNFGLTKSMSYKEILETISTNQKVDPIIKLDVVERLTKKEQKMAQIPVNSSGTNIVKLVLQNFQSHEYSVFEFTNGFNVLIGESRQGKSAVLRALRWIYENKPSGHDFVKNGKTFAKATVFLENGTVITRYIEIAVSDKGNVRVKKNGFEIQNPDGSVEEGNTKMLPTVQQKLGFTTFDIDKDLKIPLNFMKQGESWFLIGSGYTNTQRARIIGSLKETHYADAVIKDLDKENYKVLAERKASKKEVQSLEKQLEKFDYLDDVESTIKIIEEKIAHATSIKDKIDRINASVNKIKELKINITEMQELKESLKDIQSLREKLQLMKDNDSKDTQIRKSVSSYNNINKKMQNAKGFIEMTSNISDIKLRFYELKDNNEKVNKILKSLESISKIKVEINSVNEIIHQTANIEELKEKVATMKKNHEDALNLIQLYDKIKETTANIAKIQKALSAISQYKDMTSNISIVREKLIELKAKSEAIDAISKHYKLAKEKQDEINKCRKVITDKTNEIVGLVEVYAKTLEDAGICPICNGTLDKAKVSQIIQKHEGGHEHVN